MAVEIVMPRLGMVMSEGAVTKWSKSLGELVSQGEVIAEIETEKINYDLEATDSGILHPAVPEGAVVAVDGLLGYILADGEPVPEPPTPPSPSVAVPKTEVRRRSIPPNHAGIEVRSTPGARRLAARLGVDIIEVRPTGPGGRVAEGDVRAYVQEKAEATTQPLPPGLPQPSKTVPLEGIRKTIAGRMRGSIAGTAQLSYFLEVDVTEAQRLRREVASREGTTIGMLHVLMKACAETLKRHPQLNTVLSGGRVLYFDEVNIGIAAALREGLIVPVARQVDRKSILEISRETQELVAKARDRRLLPDDMAGGTFAISVLGNVDGFTPILYAGQSAILGVGRSVQKPVVRDGQVVVREMMTLSLTVDHQVIDGDKAAGFLRRLQQMVEHPRALFK